VGHNDQIGQKFLVTLHTIFKFY